VQQQPNHNPNQSLRPLPSWKPGDPVPQGYRKINGDPFARIPDSIVAVNGGAPQRRNLRPIYAPQLAGKPIPERPWLVHGWIPDRTVTLLGGDGGTGKSLLSLQLMVACALGKPWLGLAVKPCKVFALFCEDDETEVHIRLDSIARHYGADFGDLEGVGWSARSGLENVLMSFDQQNNRKIAPLWNEMAAEVKESGAQLVIIDTLADVFAGNENFRQQARSFVGQLRQLAQEIDGAVILTAHPSVAGQASGTGLSGSTAWNNSVRSRLYLTRPKESDADMSDNERVLRRMKANYAGIGDEIRMKWEDGVLIPEKIQTGLYGSIERDKAERAFIDALRSALARGLLPSHKVATRDLYAPKLLKGFPEVKGYKEKDLIRAMQDCLGAGRIEVAMTEGSPSKQREYIRPKEKAANV
jgi:RecA-family ATPase